MKTRTWILLLAGLFVLLAGVVLLQSLGAKPAGTAQLYVDGKLRQTLDLSVDQTLRIETREGWNEIAVKDGKISVTDASCPDKDCVRCGAKNSGAPIACLPNRLSIRFSDDGGVDGVTR